MVPAAVYYVDIERGNDRNSGNTKQHAWETLNKVNSIQFQPGDSILLKRGQMHPGFLHLQGCGLEESPVTLGSYGTGNRPVVNASGNPCAVWLLDADHWIIKDIEATGSNLAGIFVGCTRDGLELDHIRIANCNVNQIGDTSKIDWGFSTSTGGIVVVNGTFDDTGSPVFYNSVFNDVVIADCSVQYNYRWTCISISSGKMNGSGGNANIIRNCTAAFSAADGIRMNGVRNSLIEHCVMFRNGAWPRLSGRNLGGLGAWFFDAENCTIQYCEASWVGAAETDGGAFDIDYLQKNSTVQYCYGHHCAGYGVSVFGADPSFPTENSVVRYNIFRDNGRDSTFAVQGDFFIFTWNGGLLNGVKIYSNVSYWNPVIPAPSLNFNADLIGNHSNSFSDNVIHADQPWLVSVKNDSLRCDRNAYWITRAIKETSPVPPKWQIKNEAYHTLEDWQRATSLDKKSLFADTVPGIPEWHRTEIHGIPFRTGEHESGVHAGDKMPDFKAKINTRKWIKAADFTGHPVLLCFISANESGQPEGQSAIPAQLAYLHSMMLQYGNKGLKIIIIDSPGLGWDSHNKTTRLNFARDHAADALWWVHDKRKNNLASSFGVGQSPSTFLISPEGIVTHMWDHLALPAQLAFALEETL